MRVVLTINEVDFTPWIAENGLKYSPVERTKRSVITLDGTEHRKTIEKRQIDVTLLDMPDEELIQVEAALSYANPALVDYTDKNGVLYTGVQFYTTNPLAETKKVIGNTTYWENISFSMEQK